MTLLVISLVAGPFLFIVPFVYADKPYIPPVIVMDFEDNITYMFDISLDTIPFTDDSWKQVGEIFNVSAKNEAALDLYLNNGEVHNVEVWLLVHNKYNKWIDVLYIVQYDQFCDFDGDGDVDGQDIKIVANANSQPDLYEWRLDLNQDFYITDEDVNIANSFKGESAQWLTLPISGDPVYARYFNHPDYNRWYVATQLAHFSGFGIRR